ETSALFTKCRRSCQPTRPTPRTDRDGGGDRQLASQGLSSEPPVSRRSAGGPVVAPPASASPAALAAATLSRGVASAHMRARPCGVSTTASPGRKGEYS